tara:strand:- start:3347 stop:4195 length:849 start_codon:yes stop_codon:yes gene_type:complete
MEVIKSISIIHSASRNFKAALDQCLETAEKANVQIKSVIPVNEKKVEKTIKKKDSDLILVIGGDGTMIRTIANLINTEIPLLGINIGKLGFLTDLNVESIPKELPNIFAGNYILEQRPSLSINVDDSETLTGINEVVFHSGTVAKMLNFSIFQEERLISKHKSDGVIVSSATGSSGYLFSGGGPIIYPTEEVFAILPMFSQSSSSNPLILPNQKNLKIMLKNSVKASVVVDGREDVEVYQGSEIIISKNKKSYSLIHPLSYDYFEACRTKLSWGQPLINLDD